MVGPLEVLEFGLFAHEVAVADGGEFSVQVLVERRVHVGGRHREHWIVVHRSEMNSIINESNNIYCIHPHIPLPFLLNFFPLQSFIRIIRV